VAAVDEILDGASARRGRASPAGATASTAASRCGRRRPRLHRHLDPRHRDQKGGALTIDLSDCHPQVHGFINSSFPNTMSAVHMAFAYLIDPRTPRTRGRSGPCG